KIRKVITSNVGKVQDTRKLKYGSLLSRENYKNRKNITTFHDIRVVVSLQLTLNSSGVIINSGDLMLLSPYQNDNRDSAAEVYQYKKEKKFKDKKSGRLQSNVIDSPTPRDS
ncbi:hypothetical protein GWI33_008883, partial [Rhynchophorus ferrugineus]